MAARNASAGDVEITLPDGNTLALMLDRPLTLTGAAHQPGTPYIFESVLSAASAQTPIAPRLTTRITSGFRRGIGLDYNAAYGLYTRDGYAIPFGAATGVDISSGPLAAHNTASPIVAFAELNGTLYVAQQGLATGSGGRVLKLVGGTGIAVEDFSLAAGNLIRDMIVADNGSGVTCLYVTSESATHTNGRLHQLHGVLGTWSSTTAGTEFAATRGLGRMAYEFMQPDTSPGDYRIVCITGPKTFAYTLPNLSPMGGTANWSVDIKIGTRGQLVDIAAARRHFWLAATDNLFDVDELGASNGVTSFLPQMQQAGNGQAVLYMDGFVYMSVGRGLIRLRVDQGTVLQERPQQCAPGWGTRAENDVRGPITALCPDQGGFFSATWNPSLQRSYVCWNTVRDFETDESRNPLIAHGPEVTINGPHQVTRMLTSGLAGDLRLWIARIQVPTGVAALDWVSLPLAGSPIADIISAGPQRFVTGTTGVTDVPPPSDGPVQAVVSLETLLDDWEDGGASNVILYQDTVITRGLAGQFHDDGTRIPPDGPASDDGSGTKLAISSRCDPTPGQTTWGTRILVTGSPAQTIQSTQDLTTGHLLQGHRSQMKIDFISPYGGGNSPDGHGGFTGPPRVGVLDAVRRMGWKEEPSVRVFTLRVVYGDGVPLPFGRDPEEVTSLLKTVTESPTTGFLTYAGRRYAVKFDQVLDVREEWRDGGDFGKTVHATMQGSVLDVAP